MHLGGLGQIFLNRKIFLFCLRGRIRYFFHNDFWKFVDWSDCWFAGLLGSFVKNADWVVWVDGIGHARSDSPHARRTRCPTSFRAQQRRSSVGTDRRLPPWLSIRSSALTLIHQAGAWLGVNGHPWWPSLCPRCLHFAFFRPVDWRMQVRSVYRAIARTEQSVQQ